MNLMIMIKGAKTCIDFKNTYMHLLGQIANYFKYNIARDFYGSSVFICIEVRVCNFIMCVQTQYNVPSVWFVDCRL